MSRERELIKRATEALKFWMDETAHSVDWELLEDLESYLASEKQDQPEPVAWLYSKGDVLAGVPVIFTSATTGKDFAFQKPHYDQKPLYLHPAPRKPFVRLSEEEIMAIVRADPDFDEMMWDKTAVRFARAIEDALEEKNK